MKPLFLVLIGLLTISGARADSMTDHMNQVQRRTIVPAPSPAPDAATGSLDDQITRELMNYSTAQLREIKKNCDAVNDPNNERAQAVKDHLPVIFFKACEKLKD